MKKTCKTCKYENIGGLCMHPAGPCVDDHEEQWEPVDTESVNHPAHYIAGRKYEPLDVIEDWKLDYHTGNALKYISRAGRKGSEVEDLRKAIFYLERKINKK